MFSARSTSLMIFLLLTLPFASATTIHGIVYEWSTFEPLDNALVEVNSTPAQFRVASSGVYSFNLQPGEYLIRTSYYVNDTLEYYAEDNITVKDLEGDYVFDILLFPLQSGEEEFPEEDIGNITYDFAESALPAFDLTYTIAALVVMLLVAAAAYIHYRGWGGRKKTGAGPEAEQSPVQLSQMKRSEPLPDDLKEVLEIIRQAGGRLTQRELRGKLRCSEAKVSLMLTDLEDRGLVRKVKKGRGNVILLNRDEQ